MTITAKIIADSISPEHIRLTTFQLRYPKFIHGEFMTHRVFSRNASSSRAIPVERLIQDVLDDPAGPIHWGANQKGMQADKENDARVIVPWDFDHLDSGSYSLSNQEAWLLARDHAVTMARAFHRAGYHKQLVNRIMEPFCHINTLCTATDYQNFFSLRNHKDAQPEIRELAIQMKEAMFNSTPKSLDPGDWHLPYITDDDWYATSDFVNPGTPDGEQVKAVKQNYLLKVSVARCARVSYLTQDGKTPVIREDLNLYDRLVGGVPLHASPAEHQATPPKDRSTYPTSNLRGWIQFRKMLPGEFLPG